MITPEISIILAVKDETLLLKSAVEDILNQTFQNFELLILDDASENEETINIIKSFNDSRIKKIYCEQHHGLARIKNLGMRLSRGKYIAMMDADDRYPNTKLQLQYNFLEANVDVMFCGTGLNIINKRNAGWEVYTTDQDIKAQFYVNNPFVHPSVMFRHEIASEFKYNSDFDYAEDYELFYRISRKYTVANLPEKLIGYNVKEKIGIKKELSKNQKATAREIRNNIIKDLKLSETETEQWHLFAELETGISENILKSLFEKVVTINNKSLIIIFCKQVIHYCNATQLKLGILFKLKLAKHISLGLKMKFKFLVGR